MAAIPQHGAFGLVLHVDGDPDLEQAQIFERSYASRHAMHGSCLCGEVRFEVLGPYPWLYQCHCSLCRKQGGSTSNTGLIVAADKFKWTAGENLISKWQRPTGFRSYFCHHCGSPVPNPLRETGFVWVPSGLLDGDEPLEVGAQLFIGSKAPWTSLPQGGLQFETAPDLEDLISLLHARRGPAAR